MGTQQLLRIASRSLRQPGPAQHASHLVGSLTSLNMPDRGPGTPPRYAFLDEEMVVREAGNLWQVSDTQNLVATGQLLQLASDRLGCPAPDSGVNLVEYQGALAGAAAGPPGLVAIR